MTAVGATAMVALAPGVAGAGVRAGATYGGVLFRPVLCVVPPYDRFITTPQPALSTSSCAPVSAINVANLAVTPDGSSAGYSYQSPPPDPILEAEKTTKPSADSSRRVVLLSGLRGSSIYAATPTSAKTRYVLGPSEMNSSAIASASVSKSKSGAWVVTWTTTSSGAAQWDKVAHKSFHEMLAIDVGGVVVSAPIIEPTNKSFRSFHGMGEISGNLSQAEATKIVQAMQSQS
jgi:hypothetical protein